MSMFRAAAVICAGWMGLSSLAGGADAPARVMLVATYHLANPGQDIHNVEVDDVLAPARQAQLVAVVDALARFEPTFVGVEWPADVVDERYPSYLKGTLPPSRNEVVQLGFRLAKQRGLSRVYGLDVDGDFPFEPVQTWARGHGRAGDIEEMLAFGGRETERISQMHARSTIGAVLRHMNTPESIALNHSFYPRMLLFGAGSEQPGAALLTAWYGRNIQICARLLQALEPGARAVVFFGQGHAHLLNQCLDEAPGVERVDALGYLPE